MISGKRKEIFNKCTYNRSIIYIQTETERTTMNYYKNIIFTFLGMIIITIVYAQVPNPPNSEMSLTDAAELLTKRGYDPYSHPGSVKPLYTEEYESLRRLCMEAAEVCKVSTRQDELSEHRAGQKECVDFGGAWEKTSMKGTTMRVVCSELFKIDTDED